MGRIQQIDFLKGVSIMGVFIIHILGLTFTKEDVTIYSLYFDSFFRFAVPIFFGVLGYMTYHQYRHVTDWKRFYRSKVFYIFVPYLLWSFVYVFVPTIYQFTDGKELTVLQVLLGYTEVHLYFMVPYLTFLIGTPLIVRLIKVMGEAFVSKLSLYAVAIFMLIFIFIEQSVMKQESHVLSKTDIRTIANWVGYYAMGLYVALNQQQLKTLFGDLAKMRKLRFLLLSTVYVMAVFLFTITAKVIFPYETPYLLPLSLIATFLLVTLYEKKKGKKWVKQISQLGTHTFPFYLSHVLFIKWGYLWFCVNGITATGLIMTALFGLICSLSYVWLHHMAIEWIKQKLAKEDN